MKLIHKIETGLLIVTFSMILGLGITQIIMRNVFDTGLVWNETLTRILVLWIGLLGAMLASRKANHIRIDLLSRYLSDKHKTSIMIIGNVFTAGICFWLANLSAQFTWLEYQEHTLAFASLPNWLFTLILPFAFTVIGLRYFFLAFPNKA